MKKVRIADVIKDVAKATVSAGVVADKDYFVSLMDNLTAGIDDEDLQVGDEIKKELLISEVFIGHFALKQFLTQNDKTELLDSYLSEVDRLLSSKYKYLISEKEINSFNELAGDRFEEYEAIIQDSSDPFVSLADKVLGHVLTKQEEYPPVGPIMTLSLTLSNRLVEIGKFLKEVSDNFEF